MWCAKRVLTAKCSLIRKTLCPSELGDNSQKNYFLPCESFCIKSVVVKPLLRRVRKVSTKWKRIRMYKTPATIPDWTFINLSASSDPTYAQDYGDFHLPSLTSVNQQPATTTTTTTTTPTISKAQNTSKEESDEEYSSSEYEDEYSDQDPDDKHKGRVTVILYTSAAEMAESEEYVDQMSASMRFSRNISNALNLVNSSYSTHTLEWEPMEKRLTLSNDTCNGVSQPVEVSGRCGGLCTATDTSSSGTDYITYTRKTDIGVLGMGKVNRQQQQKQLKEKGKDSGGGGGGNNSHDYQRIGNMSKVGDQYVRWDKRTSPHNSAIVSCTRPCYCHVELRLGSYTYSIRWGGKITKTENKKYYNSSMVYTVLNINLNEKSYDRLKAFCDHQWRYAVTRFNHFGVYFNFLAPDFLRKAVCSNGNSYWSGDAVYCSEFLARAFCHIGIFDDMHNVWRGDNVTAVAADLHSLSLFEHDLVVDDEIFHLVGKDGRISVDPAMVSPNTLYILLQIKKYLCISLATRKDDNATLSVDHTIFRGNLLFAIDEGILV